MRELALTIQSHIVAYSVYAILLGLLALFSYYFYQKIKKQTGNSFVASLFVITCIGMASVAFPTSNQKQTERKERIEFLQTGEIVNLVDEGSWVGTNRVHLAFSVRLLPPSAELRLDYISKEEPIVSNNYSNHIYGIVGSMPNIIDFEFPNAQSNRWVFYTTFTQGPNVHTNGVAVAEFLKAQKYDNIAVPKRSSIWEGEKMIYPAPEKVNLLEEIGLEND